MTDSETRVFGGRYSIDRLIARGGMAEVFLAHDQLLDRPVALKVLFPELSVDPNFVERFRREAQNAAKLSHPNIVSVYDWGEDASTYFIVMEYVDGESLSALLHDEGSLNPQRGAEIGAEVASALAFAHRNGVVHRDVKPGNVLIDSRGSVKVTDFGIARARNTTENLTQTGAVMGTATYFSPEQAQGLTVDQRSDVYSLGVVLYEMVAGKPPFSGDNPVTIAYKHVRESPPSLREIDPSIPSAFEAIVLQCIAKSPKQRYASADELRADLDRFRNGQLVQARSGVSTAADPTRTLASYRSSELAYRDSTRTIASVPTAPPMPAGPSKRGLKKGLVVLIGLLAVSGIAAFLWFSNNALTSSASNGLVQIPNVVGQHDVNAENALKAKELKWTINRSANTAPIDQVFSQDPSPSTVGHQGDTVHLSVSDGPPPATLPDVTNETLDQARRALTALGLTVVTTDSSSDTVDKGRVVAQNPPAQSQVATGGTVTLTLSSGPQQVDVPNLTGFTVSGAAEQLTEVGLRTATPPNSNPTDLVTQSNPAAGTQVAKGSTVTLLTASVLSSTTSSSTTAVMPSTSSTTSTTLASNSGHRF